VYCASQNVVNEEAAAASQQAEKQDTSRQGEIMKAVTP
jgi:hypothetical protein